MGGGRGDSRGSDPRGRDPGWTGRDSGPRRASGSGWDPGPPAWRDGDPGADAQTRRMPVPRGVRGDGSLPSEVRGDGSPRDKQQGVPGGRPPGSTPPTGTRVAMTQPSGIDDGAARGPGGPRDSRGRRSSPRPRGPGRTGRWGTLQGGLGVCIIVASAAVGAILTMVARSAPGFLLGLCVVAGTVTASLAVRPRAGRLIFPVPVLSYLVAALISGVVFERPADLSKTALAIDSAQWIADGFFAMALATLLAVVITAARWFRWRRGRPTAGDPGRPVPPADPSRTGSARTPPTWDGSTWAGSTRAGSVRTGGTGRDGTARQPRAGFQTAESGYPASLAGPDRRWESGPGRRPWGSRGSWRSRDSRGPRRLGRSWPARHRLSPEPASLVGTLQLLQRGIAEHQVLDAVVGTEVDLRLGLVAIAVARHHGAQAELVVGHHVPR